MGCTPARCACLYGLSPFPSVLRISPISTLLIWRLYCLSKMAFRSANNWKQNKENEIEKNVSLILRSTKNSLLVCFFLSNACVCVCVGAFIWFVCLFGVFTYWGKTSLPFDALSPPTQQRLSNPAQCNPFFFCYTGWKLFHAFADSAVTESRYLRISWWICVYGTYIYSMYLPGLLAHLVNNLRCAQQYSRHVNKWKCEWECDISIRPTWHPLDTHLTLPTKCQRNVKQDIWGMLQKSCVSGKDG